MNKQSRTGTHHQGFSLLELLVVVALVLVLMALLFPAIRGINNMASRTTCASNMRFIQQGYSHATTDRGGKLPGGHTRGGDDWVRYRRTSNMQLQRQAIEQGVIWPYVREHKVFMCPDYPFPTYARHYSLAATLNGERWGGMPRYLSFGGVKMPAKTIALIEEPDPRFGLQGSWVTNPREGRWVDPVGSWHNIGVNFTFLDGHVEYWRWEDSRTVISSFVLGNSRGVFYRNTPNNPDLRRIKNHLAPGHPSEPADWKLKP